MYRVCPLKGMEFALIILFHCWMFTIYIYIASGGLYTEVTLIPFPHCQSRNFNLTALAWGFGTRCSIYIIVHEEIQILNSQLIITIFGFCTLCVWEGPSPPSPLLYEATKTLPSFNLTYTSSADFHCHTDLHLEVRGHCVELLPA